MPKATPAYDLFDLIRLAFDGFLPTASALETLLDRMESAE